MTGVLKVKVDGVWQDVTVQGPQGIDGGLTPHHVKHEPGGTDAIINAAWINLANTFTQDQTIFKSDPLLTLGDAVNVRKARIFENVGRSVITNNLKAVGSAWIRDDPAVIGTLIVLDHNQMLFMRSDGTNFSVDFQTSVAGDFVVVNKMFERGRTIAVGETSDITFNAGDFTTDNPGVWTINNYNTYTFSLVGNTLTLWWHLVGTLSGGSFTNLYMKIPFGLSGKKLQANTVQIVSGPNFYSGFAYALNASTNITINMPAGAVFPAGAFTTFGQIAFTI